MKRKKLRILLSGGLGKMGQSVARLAVVESLGELRGIVDHTLRSSRAKEGTSFSSEILKFPDWDHIEVSEKFDVVVDFSAPQAFEKALKWCQQNQTPLVSGTTGLSSKQFRLMKVASKRIAILWSPNMSLGMAFFRKMIPLIVNMEQMGSFDFQIEEVHHRAKKDAPSGTALELQKILEKWSQKRVPEPLSIRGGGVFGIHRLLALGDDETLMVEHNALSRDVFARGALKAAGWLVGKKRGVYCIDDVISKYE